MAEPRPTWFDQSGWDLRFDWGLDGLRNLAPASDVVVVVDVLRFTTAVDVAVGRGALVFPYRWHDGSELAYAGERGAVLAERTTSTAPGPPWSLSPNSLSNLPSGQALVLPSPNGSTLCADATAAGARAVFAGCLRNATLSSMAATAAARSGSGVVSVIAAGERWGGTDGALRPALEDLIGAGAILGAAAAAGARPSPEARHAIASFEAARPNLAEVLSTCASGRELIGRGMEVDIGWAADFDVSDCASRLEGDRFVAGSD